MDFNNIFSSAELLGVFLKQYVKDELRKGFKNQPKDLRIAQYKVLQEAVAELLEEENA